MRKVTLNPEEASIVYGLLDRPADPRIGLTMQEVRKNAPLMDMLERNAEKIPVSMPTGDKGYRIIFKEASLALEEDQFDLIKSKLDNSSGWNSVEDGRKADRLFLRLKEIPAEKSVTEKS